MRSGRRRPPGSFEHICLRWHPAVVWSEATKSTKNTPTGQQSKISEKLKKTFEYIFQKSAVKLQNTHISRGFFFLFTHEMLLAVQDDKQSLSG